MTSIKQFLPIIKSIKSYNREIFKTDLSAGIMVAILLVPQAIAYAYLAGMPPEYGLYTAIVPGIIYALMATTPHLAVGPVAVSALLIMAGVSQLEDPFTSEYVELVILAGLLIGIVQVLFSVFRLSKLINLLSYPVITGFTSAASIIVIINQFSDIFGMVVPRELSLLGKVIHIFENYIEINWYTVLIGSLTFLAIFIFKKINKRVPYGLIIVALGILLSYIFDFERMGIATIGFVPSGLPSFHLPTMNVNAMIALIPTVLIVSIIGIIESIGISKAIEGKNDFYKVDTKQELLGLGTAKILGSFFNAIPSSGSFSRSAILHESRAKTSLASLFTVGIVTLAVLFLTPLLSYLPKVILAVIIVNAVKNLFEHALAVKLLKRYKLDALVMISTFVLTIFVGIEIGVLSGFIISIVVMILNCPEKMKALKNLVRFNHEESYEIKESDCKEVALYGQMNFANAEEIKQAIIIDDISEKDLIIDLEKVGYIDYVGVLKLMEIQRSVEESKSKLIFTNANQKVGRTLKKEDLQ